MNKEGSVNMSSAQQVVNKMIEATLFQLTAQVNVEQFEQVIQQNLAAKEQATTSTTQFYDALMLNIVYFFENKKSWQVLVESMFTGKEILAVESFEQEMLTQQMMIRQDLDEKQQAYTEQFHPQYKNPEFTRESICYEYAFESLAHSLRTDFTTQFIRKFANSPVLLEVDVAETIRVMDGTIEYHVSNIVNNMNFA